MNILEEQRLVSEVVEYLDFIINFCNYKKQLLSYDYSVLESDDWNHLDEINHVLKEHGELICNLFDKYSLV